MMADREQKIVGVIRSNRTGVTRLVTNEDGQTTYEAFTLPQRPREEPRNIIKSRPQPITSRKYTGGRG